MGLGSTRDGQRGVLSGTTPGLLSCWVVGLSGLCLDRKFCPARVFESHFRFEDLDFQASKSNIRLCCFEGRLASGIDGSPSVDVDGLFLVRVKHVEEGEGDVAIPKDGPLS